MDRSHEPTPRRRQLAREQGHVAKSRDLAAAVLLTAGIGLVLLMGEGVVKYLGELTTAKLSDPPALSLDADGAVEQWNEILAGLAGTLLPPLVLMFAAGVVGHFAQTGLLFQPQRLAPDFDRINPLNGLARIFSLAGLTGTVQALLKIAVVVTVGGWCVWSERETILGLASLSPGQLAVFLCDFLPWTALKIAGVLLMAGLLDYGFQRWRYEESLRMTPEEVKEELRQLQVDPQVTARRKRLLRQRANDRLEAAVRQASCLVTTPDGLAIAIEYRDWMRAPRVIAKAAAASGQRLRRAAEENGVPILEDPALARLLNRLRSGDEIPPSLFHPVAAALGSLGKVGTTE